MFFLPPKLLAEELPNDELIKTLQTNASLLYKHID